MPNTYVNKVTANGQTLIDLTADTAVASDVAQGKYFHLATGERVQGTASGGGGDSYTLTTVVPQQTFTAQVLDNSYQTLLTYTAGLEDGESYLVTFDGEQYLCDCGIMWGSDCMAGTIALLWDRTANDVYPFGLDYVSSTPEFGVGVADMNQHTIKIEHIEFVDGPLNLIAKSVTVNGTYSASSDNADGYSSVTVNVPTGSSDDFVVTLSYNEQTEMWEPDCTYAEAAAAASAGKSIVVDADVPSVDATADGEWNDFLQHLEYWVYQYYDSANGGIVETQYRLTANGLIVQGTTTYVVEPTGSMTITQNGTGIDVAQYASVDVAVPTGGTYQAKTNINPTTSSQTITPDSGYDALSSVQINAMPTGTAGTPSATKGTVSNHSVSVTPSVTNTTGYITGGTKTGTAVTVSASELVSGSQTITENGTVDVTALAEIVVNVAGSSAQTATGTFTGNGTRTINIACNFEPDIVYFTSNPGTTASSGTVAAIIVRGLMAATRYRNNSTTNSSYAAPGIVGMNTSGSSYSWRATYANSTVTLYCFSNSTRALLTSGRTYTYTFIKWT